MSGENSDEVSVTLFEDEGNDGPQQQQSASEKYMAKMKSGAGSAASMFQSAFESAREKTKPARTSMWEQTAAATKAVGESAVSLAEKTKAAAAQAGTVGTSAATPHPPTEPPPEEEETETRAEGADLLGTPSAPPPTAASKITSGLSMGWQSIKAAKERASQSKTAESAGTAATAAATSTFMALDKFGAFIGKSSNVAAKKAKDLPAQAPAVIAKVKATTEAGLSGLRTGKWPVPNAEAPKEQMTATEVASDEFPAAESVAPKAEPEKGQPDERQPEVKEEEKEKGENNSSKPKKKVVNM
jgi:hypothetical protein